MNTKEQRLYTIQKIIRTEIIRSQEDLLNSLIKKGFNVTQATLSRDIKLLNIIKQHDGNGLYVYTLPEPASSAENAAKETGLLNIEFSGNLAVVKTRPGYAMGIASDIDMHAPREILGTIAGDDTILIIPREGFDRKEIAKALVRFIN
ncbi:MAG: ArgR family transcriptional regulator [Tannerella sp.]|jgi:transcriptional regulator of arginine metabolism|nr:ArgR family transcriptional regulator [Tannerella sp.]